LWAHASNTTRLAQSFDEIAEKLKIRGRNQPSADVFQLVHNWLLDEKNGPWLFVVDNADDAGVISMQTSTGQQSQTEGGASAGNSGGAPQRHLSDYLPPSEHGAVIVTSRAKQAAMHLVEDSDVILIEPMDAFAARTLLRKELGDIGDKEVLDDSVVELAAALDHMPLALAQAAAYIRRLAPRCSVQQYLEKYKRSDSEASSLLNHAAGHLRRDKSASNAILLTWQISFDHVRKVRQSAADLLSLMSFFDRQGIPEDLLYGYHGTVEGNDADDDDTEDDDTEDDDTEDDITGYSNCFEDDLDTLRDYSFVTVKKDVNMFEMHSLVQLATRKWLESQDQLLRWREQFISNLCAELPSGRYENWERCQALFPHAKAAMTQRPQSMKSLKQWALLLYNAGWYAYERGRADDAEKMSMLSKNVRSDVLGEESAKTLASMSLVGRVMTKFRSKYEEAEVIERQVLKTSIKVLGREHPDTLNSIMSIGSLLRKQGKSKEEEEIKKRELTTKLRVLGHTHPGTLTAKNNLGLMLMDQGKYEEGEAMYKQILAISQKVHGPEHPHTLIL
jgi:tetratricopeptide (TPR) repeat protein